MRLLTRPHPRPIFTLLLGLLASLMAFAPSALGAAPARTMVSAGQTHTCAVLADKSIQCWGKGTDGQLGNDSLVSSSSPVRVREISDAVAVSTGESHSCAIVTGGAVKCWGNGANGRLGNGAVATSKVPVTVTGITSATAVAAANDFTCALVGVGGNVKCWGSNLTGQLGDDKASGTQSTTPVDVAGFGSGATAISTHSSSRHACAVKADQTVWCWGDNSRSQIGNMFGQLGLDQPTPDQALTITGATAVSVGLFYTCALLQNQQVQCWGSNDAGRLGNGQTTGMTKASASSPISGLDSATSVSASDGFTCARTVGGAAKCWGANTYGMLGNGTQIDSLIPVTVSGASSDVTQLAVGAQHACALIAGALKCWGQASSGQLGTWGGTLATTPVDVTGGLTGVDSLALRALSSCAVGGGQLKCWGAGFSGSTSTPGAATIASGVTDAAPASSFYAYHYCAVVSGGVQCWGQSNNYGELGNGTDQPSLLPTYVQGLGAGSGATAVATGEQFSCAVVNGGVRCWGNQGDGRVGNNTGVGSQLTPVQVQGLPDGSNVTDIAAGEDFACAVVAAKVTCWGDGYDGKLGNNLNADKWTPDLRYNGQPIERYVLDGESVPAPIDGVTSIAAGKYFACAIAGGGTKVMCWGKNSKGQLGTGSNSDYRARSDAAIGITGGVTAITAGDEHACAVVNDGVRCWGSNASSQLGTSTQTAIQRTPVQVSGIPDGSNASGVGAGQKHSCAIVGVTKTVRCWGEGSNGQLGTGPLSAGGHYPIALTPMLVPDCLTCDSDPTPPDNNPTPPGNNDPGQGGSPTQGSGATTPVVTAPVAPRASLVKLQARQTLKTIAKTGSLRVTIPVAQGGVTVSQQLTISAKMAKQLRLKVPRKAKTVVVGAGRTTTTRAGTATVVIKLTRPAKKAFQTTRTKRLPVTIVTRLSQSGKTSSVTTKATLR